MALSKAEQLELAALEQLEAETQAVEPVEQQEQTAGQYAGGALESLGQGLSLGFQDELTAGLTSAVTGEDYENALRRTRLRQERFGELNPKTDIGARLAGNIVTGIATGGVGGNVIAREAALGGIEGFGSAADDRLTGAAYGGAMGGAFAKGGDILGSVFSRPSASQRVVDGIGEVAERAEKRAGKRLLTKAQRTGSASAKKIEAGLENLPIAGGATQRIKANFQEELNKKAAASIGQDATKLTDDVLTQAQDDISEMYRAATIGREIPVYPDDIIAMADIVDSVKKLPSRPDTATKIGDNIIDELMSGRITDARYQELSQDVRGALFKAQKAGDTPNMKALSKINEALDSMVENGLGGEALDQFKEARSLYRNFKVLTSKTGTINPATGDVSGKMLFNELAKGGKAHKVSGELGDLARLSKISGVGDSGTAARLLPTLAVGAIGGAGLAGALDVSGTMIGSIGAMRLLDEAAQAGVPGLTAEGMGMLGGAVSRTLE